MIVKNFYPSYMLQLATGEFVHLSTFTQISRKPFNDEDSTAEYLKINDDEKDNSLWIKMGDRTERLMLNNEYNKTSMGIEARSYYSDMSSEEKTLYAILNVWSMFNYPEYNPNDLKKTLLDMFATRIDNE